MNLKRNTQIMQILSVKWQNVNKKIFTVNYNFQISIIIHTIIKGHIFFGKFK